MKNKTKLNQGWRYLSLIIAFLAFSIQSFAYDFLVDGIYYKITNSLTNEVSVTLKLYSPGGRYESATIISDYAGQVVVPSSVVYGGTTYTVTGIDNYAFDDSDVTSIKLPNTIRTIGNSAFAYCALLTEIELPSSVVSIGSSPFTGSGIKKPVTYGNTLLYCPTSYEGEYHIPMGITELAGSVFSECTKITKVIIPYGVERIPEYAFNGCSALKSVSIPSSMISVSNCAFQNCSSLEECVLPPSVTYIGKYAFAYCTSLSSFVLPATMNMSVEDDTFDRCTSLKEVTFPKGVTNIKVWAFANTHVTDVYNFASCLPGQSEGPTDLRPERIHVPEGWVNSGIYSPISGTIVYDLQPVTSLSINKTNLTIEEDVPTELQCAITPSNASVKTLHWSSNNTDVAIVDNNGNISAVGAGTAVITVSTLDGSNLSKTCTIVVEEPYIPIPTHDIIYIVDGNEYQRTTVEEGATINLIDAPTKEGYTFSGWSGYPEDLIMPNDDVTITGSFVKNVDPEPEIEPDTDISDISNTIYFDNCEAFCGKTVELPIKMKNDIAATGFQFDIILPEGITAVQDEDGFYDITLSPERTTAAKTNTFDSSLMSDGSIRVLAASTRNYAFSGNDGEVCKIKLNVNENLPAGEYPIIIKNIELTNAQGQTWNVERLKRTITVKDYQLGDANGDGRVSVGDFSAIANHILGSTPDGFNLGAADANQDNNISVGDLSTVATMILTEEAGGASMAKVKARRSAELNDPNNYIYASPVTISEDGDATIVFNMKNEITATGFQFNFMLPEGFSVTEDEDGFLDVFLSQTRTTSRKTNTFDCVKWSDGSYRVLAASTKNYEFSGNDGEVVTVHIKKNDNVESGDYSLILTDIELTNAQGETFRTSKATYTITVPSNSNEIALIDGEPYDNPSTTTCDKLTFTKTFSASAAGNWNAFYVPMSVNVEEFAGNLDFAEIYAFCATVDTNGDGVVDADDENFLFVRPVKTGSIKPNVPYLIRPHEAKTYIINSVDNVLHKATEGKIEFGTTIEKYTVTGLNNSFTVTASDNNFYVSATGKLNYRTTGSTTVKANRWIMHRVSMEYGGGDNNDIAGAKEYRIITIGEDMDEATVIKAINALDADNIDVYTLDGRKVNDTKTLPNGIYIKNGKKIVVNK